MLSSVLVIVPFLGLINAANDWTKPCTKGQCFYDLPATNAASAGTMKIWGSEDAITDITAAADWQILGCDPAAIKQDIRLVCMNNAENADSLCSHLYKTTGAVNKIVRLPENCGANAFARVSRAWVPEDQSIPSAIKARLVRRGGPPPVVKALALDTNFDEVDWSKTGQVKFSVQGASLAGTPRGDIDPRGFFGDLGNKIGGVFTKAVDKVTSVADKAADAATSKVVAVATAAASKVRTAAGSAATVAADVNKINPSKTFKVDPLVFDKSLNLFNSSIDCGPVKAKMSVDVTAKASAQPSLKVGVEGTLVPFEITAFNALAGMTAKVEGKMTVAASIIGRLDSGQILLFEAGVPGFDFPGIMSIGPSFQINAQMVGDVSLPLKMVVGLNFDIKDAQLSFPPNNALKPDTKAFTIGDTPLTLDATPGVNATGTITAHIIPSLNLGLTVLGGKVATAAVFIALDTSAALTLGLGASKAAKPAKPARRAARRAAPLVATSEVVKRAAEFGGCFSVVGGVDVKAGVKGKLFKLFNKVESVSLFSKKFNVFKKCFGDSKPAPPKRDLRMRRVSARARLETRLDLKCPIPGLADLRGLTSGTVAASAIPVV
ncbi:hypothetical protein B0H15DRAFT_956646 [Mycena belliarum]|uniref:DUF7223 domain-containing protein n=1 Tax=Mycena belliarum TaxID=1033014 RepID=A0AAD6TNU2_9AGAR|nr:hypothetical protein B0H15DRAFT_956646 [Mycena belliae]